MSPRSLLFFAISLFLVCGAASAERPLAHHWEFQTGQRSGSQIKPTTGSVALTLPEGAELDGEAPFGWKCTGAGFVEIPATQQANVLPDGPLTLATWVRVDRFPGWTGILSALEDNGGNEQGWMLGLQGETPCIAIAGRESADADGVLTYVKSSRSVVAGRWMHLVATYDLKRICLYLDGELVGQSEAQRGAILYPKPVRVAVGAYVDRNETYPLFGRLGTARILPQAWSAREVLTAFQQSEKRYPDDAVEIEVDRLAGFPVRRHEPDLDGVRVPTAQRIAPLGETWVFPTRPVDGCLSPDGTTIAVKDNTGVLLFDVATRRPTDRLTFSGAGASMHGLLFDQQGQRLWVTTAQQTLFEATVGPNGWAWSRRFSLPGPGGGNSHACGIAHDVKRNRLYVCLSRNNTVAEVDLNSGKILRQFPVGVAPYDVAFLKDEKHLVVSNWGGRRPREGEQTATSSGTPVLVDDRGIAKSGTVGLIEIERGVQIKEVATGLHPADIVYDADADQVFVANANSDTITTLQASTLVVQGDVVVRPDPKLPFGSATNALSLSADGLRLFAANAGNNAVAVLSRTNRNSERWEVDGFLPTGWYPSGVVTGSFGTFVVNTKGLGSRTPTAPGKYRVHGFLGAVSWVPPLNTIDLEKQTRTVRDLSRVPQMLRHIEREALTKEISPVPVPKRRGEPSVFRHVVYIIKENRTYDQVFGDLQQGDGEPTLCDYPRRVTPNHHKLAEEFVLLDNFYCNGVNSADGHSWATEGNVTDHLEKSFGGFTRSYTFGDDPLTFSSTGFIWDNVLLHGLSFRNYGEMDYAEPVPKGATFKQIYEDFRTGKNEITFRQKIGIETLARYSCPTYPGWNMRIPDVLRASRFIAELREAEKSGEWYHMSIVYLPQDHTSGLSPGMPRPESHMADNDLALGQVVEAISKSRFWKETCIFVIEDDPQAGYDHIDGHRSIGMVISPWTKRKQVVSTFYNQTSVLHTMERILGLPPMNQMDAAAPLMTECFATDIDLTPYTAVVPEVPLDRIVGAMDTAPEGMRRWYVKTSEQDFEGFDRADDSTMNQILWHAAHGADAPYPAAWAGAHGRGLKSRRLVITGDGDDDDG